MAIMPTDCRQHDKPESPQAKQPITLLLRFCNFIATLIVQFYIKKCILKDLQKNTNSSIL